MAKNVNDFWIGDQVNLKSSGRKGIFKGKNDDGRARIAIDKTIILTNVSNIEVYEEKENFDDILRDLAKPTTTSKSSKPNNLFSNVIDLHIETLAPHLKNHPSAHILEYQITKCKEFIDQCMEKKIPFFTIVHGKGQGVLKNAVTHLLTLYPMIKVKTSKNDDGAVEVWW